MAYGVLLPSMGSRKKSAYGFVNETAIRVGAGIMFTIGLFTFLSVYYAGKYELVLIIVWIFWLDFVLKVINPQFSIIGNIAKFLVRHKEPVWVGAIQKRFAWMIGLMMSSVVFVALINRVVIHHNLHYIPETISWPMYFCIVCLAFMWLESVLWRCAGCKIFEFLVKHGIMKNKDHQNCPDGECEL